MLRIGDKLGEALKIPPQYKDRIVEVRKYCTKPELEMLLIITEGLDDEFEKVKSKRSPKEFSKEHIQYGRKRYDNSTAFFRIYYGELTGAIRRYKQIKGKHQKDELYLADLLR